MMAPGYAGQLAVYFILALLFGWFVTHCVARAVLEWERVAASDETHDDDVSVLARTDAALDSLDEHEFV